MGNQPERREILFLPGALREYESACVYYESQERGLGERFRRQLLDRLDAIGSDPASFPVVHTDIRETLVRTFPFAICKRR
jgi:hypothetical protein